MPSVDFKFVQTAKTSLENYSIKEYSCTYVANVCKNGVGVNLNDLLEK
jgi:hypothetical protein